MSSFQSFIEHQNADSDILELIYKEILRHEKCNASHLLRWFGPKKQIEIKMALLGERGILDFME